MNPYGFLCVVACSFCSPVFSDKDFYQGKACCSFHGPNYEDVEYTITARFNKHNMVEYNSTRGNWTGFTEYSIKVAQTWNADPQKAFATKSDEQFLCEDIKRNYSYILDVLKAAPITRMNLVKQPDGEHPAMLVCSAYSFYPKQIQLTWLRNDQKVTKGVSNSDVISDGEFYYQFHSQLQYTPTSGEKISCMVEHFSLREPSFVVWDNSIDVKRKLHIAFGLCGLIIGLIFLIVGLFYYKKTSAMYNDLFERSAVMVLEDQTAAGNF